MEMSKTRKKQNRTNDRHIGILERITCKSYMDCERKFSVIVVET